MKKFFLFILVIPLSIFSSTQSNIRNAFQKDYHPNNQQKLHLLKKEVMKSPSKSVPILIEVMKNNQFPDQNRWIATFLLAKVLGKKSSQFISQFLENSQWFMRMASLKTLLIMNEKRFAHLYAKRLKDHSSFVRKQALENIKALKITSHAPHVWAMVYDKRNYTGIKLIKEIIKVTGDLKFKKALKPLVNMIKKEKYKAIVPEIEYALAKITNLKIPKGNIFTKRNFWIKKIKI